MEPNFIRELMGIGILSYHEQERLWDIVKRCKTAGLPLGIALGSAGAAVGTITVPGVGAVPGWAIGALVGFAVGTFECTSLNFSQREILGSFARGSE